MASRGRMNLRSLLKANFQTDLPFVTPGAPSSTSPDHSYVVALFRSETNSSKSDDGDGAFRLRPATAVDSQSAFLIVVFVVIVLM